MNQDPQTPLKLPTAVVGQTDINRVLRELGALDDFFLSASARSAGTAITPPRVTYMLQQLARENQSNLMEADHRETLKQRLAGALKTAPVLHISFATEPSPRITDSILSWLRSNVHPYALLVIGLQPTIAAGCVLRTSNKIFDMSLRSHLHKQEDYLVRLIQGAVSAGR
jgi:F0F1-type ATP synthase delta subunit